MSTVTTTLPSSPSGTYPALTVTGPAATWPFRYTVSWTDDGSNTWQLVGEAEMVLSFLYKIKQAITAGGS